MPMQAAIAFKKLGGREGGRQGQRADILDDTVWLMRIPRAPCFAYATASWRPYGGKDSANTTKRGEASQIVTHEQTRADASGGVCSWRALRALLSSREQSA